MLNALESNAQLHNGKCDGIYSTGIVVDIATTNNNNKTAKKSYGMLMISLILVTTKNWPHSMACYAIFMRRY